ncbi:MAG: hypothetical protein MMC23_007616 [Stictis urceolatum]|nr:hypothetical protein [Stictis urceolata]
MSRNETRKRVGLSPGIKRRLYLALFKPSSALTSSNKVDIDLTGSHAQEQCALVSKLPSEIRLSIWEHCVAEMTLYLNYKNSSQTQLMRGMVCYHYDPVTHFPYTVSKQSFVGLMMTCKRMSVQSPFLPYLLPQYDLSYHISLPIIDILLSYAEALPTLCTFSIFSTSNPRIVSSLPSILPQRQLPLIRIFHFDWAIHYPPFMNHPYGEEESKDWHTLGIMCDALRVMTGLRELVWDMRPSQSYLKKWKEAEEEVLERVRESELGWSRDTGQKVGLVLSLGWEGEEWVEEGVRVVRGGMIWS